MHLREKSRSLRGRKDPEYRCGKLQVPLAKILVSAVQPLLKMQYSIHRPGWEMNDH
jgi:hypothetical protein